MGILTDPDALPQLIGDYRSADAWQVHINALFYGFQRHNVQDFYQTFASADYRLAHALAADYFERVGKREKASSIGTRLKGEKNQAAGPLVIHEWGCGNGNLAACFLTHLRSLDTEGVVYPRVRYVLVDTQQDFLDVAKTHPDLESHGDRVETLCADVMELQEVPEGSVDRIFCNELWNELPTKLMIRSQGEIEEEFLRPNLKENRYAAINHANKWASFVQAFDGGSVEALREYHPFLDDIIWEKEYRKVEWKDVPFRKTIADMLKQIDEQVLVPVNVGACLSLQTAKRVLAANSIGFSSFDAGTKSLDVLNDPDKPCYGQFGGQYSFIVNLLLLDMVARFLGMAHVEIEHQKEFVGRSLATNVVSLMDLLSTHPSVATLKPWEQDALIIQTIQVLNESYSSPYKRKIEFPLQAGAPDSERVRLEQALNALKDHGVPDTIAYLTEDEVLTAQKGLETLGYDAESVPAALGVPPQGVDYSHLFVSPGS